MCCNQSRIFDGTYLAQFPTDLTNFFPSTPFSSKIPHGRGWNTWKAMFPGRPPFERRGLSKQRILAASKRDHPARNGARNVRTAKHPRPTLSSEPPAAENPARIAGSRYRHGILNVNDRSFFMTLQQSAQVVPSNCLLHYKRVEGISSWAMFPAANSASNRHSADGWCGCLHQTVLSQRPLSTSVFEFDVRMPSVGGSLNATVTSYPPWGKASSTGIYHDPPSP